jgi:hypothetical protein
MTSDKRAGPGDREDTTITKSGIGERRNSDRHDSRKLNTFVWI